MAAAGTAEELAVQRQSILTCWIVCPERRYDSGLWANSTDILEGWHVAFRVLSVGINEKTGKVVVIIWGLLESVGRGDDVDGIKK